MASILNRKDSGWYWIKVKAPDGTWKAEATRIRKDDSRAERKLKLLIAEKETEEHRTELGGGGGWDWVAGYMRIRYHGSPKTHRRILEAWTSLVMWFDDNKLFGPRDVTHAHCLQYPGWRTNQPKERMQKAGWNTALMELKVLGMILQQAVVRNIIIANPAARLGLRRETVKKKPEITGTQQAQIELALKTAPQWMRDSWLISMRQGVRISETAIPMHQIDLARKTLYVIGKGRKVHAAPLHEDLIPLIKEAKKKKLKVLVELPRNPSKCWSQWFHKNNFTDLSFHSTRVTVITRLLRVGHSKAHVQAYVGHASETIQDIYNRLSAPDVRHLGAALKAGASNPPDENQGETEANPKPTEPSTDHPAS
ncbi:MAG: hypothetical protein B9S32_13710 [Verrucomicrobia bacterium Tous-C9LFEB]|nr:MAG: hypothetical protein B9S32_13710 [Verrucomicrobia bacterium Tous-C9LFEB]